MPEVFQATIEPRAWSFEDVRLVYRIVGDWVEFLLDDRQRRLPSCTNVRSVKRMATFELYEPTDDEPTLSVLESMAKRGLRPALLEELLCFDDRFPDVVDVYVLVALGTVAVVPYGDGFESMYAYLEKDEEESGRKALCNFGHIGPDPENPENGNLGAALRILAQLEEAEARFFGHAEDAEPSRFYTTPMTRYLGVREV